MPKESEIEIKLVLKSLNISNLIKNSHDKKLINQGYMDMDAVSVIKTSPKLIRLSDKGIDAEVTIPDDLVDDLEKIFNEKGEIKKELEPSVRIRTTKKNNGEESFEFTIKTTNNDSVEDDNNLKVRTEFNVPLLDESLIAYLYLIAGKNIVEKVRFFLPSNLKDVIWEVDIYNGENNGLVTAEAEIKSLTSEIPKPLDDWEYEDAGNNFSFTNDSLSRIPFSKLDMPRVELVFF